ncbi:TRAP transporter small permease [Arenibaculum pallidiluteum]|uniref:TRAP transporter small permease n=1 Tax=Arenibaculum pallidiluteum TaxID=2812559 RepID=UPI001A96D297|nr:TRAP transporter small permease [Arenibaculum pallidiluteum]
MSNTIYFIESVVGRILLATIVLLVFCAGVSRSFGYPLVWSMDVAQLLFVWTTFIGADMTMRKRSLIAVDLFIRWTSPRQRAFVDLFCGVLILAFLVTMVVMGYRLVMLNLEREFGDSGISYAWVTSAVPVGCLLLAITLTGQLIETVRSLWNQPLPVFTSPRAAVPNFEETAL